MRFRFGDMVKIQDIGLLVKYIRKVGKEVELEICGEKFWLPEHCITPTFYED